MTLSVHDYATNAGGASGSGTLTVQPSASPDDIVVVAIFLYASGGSPVVTGVTDTGSAGLTFTKRASYTWGTNNLMEVWWAHTSGSLSAETIEFAFTGTGNLTYSGIAYAVTGADTSSPWDSNGALPVENNSSGSTTATSGSISTTNATSILLSWCGGDMFDDATANSPQTQITSKLHSGSDYSDLVTGYYNVSSSQSGATLSYTVGQTYFNWGMIVDAMVPPLTPSLTGTWSSTDAKDAMAFTGLGPINGTWASTDAKDALAFTGTVPITFSLDGYAVGGNGGGGGGLTSGTVTLSTSQDNELICVYVVTGGHFNAGQVTSITDTADLVWHRRHKRTQNGSEPFIELWWAHAPTPLSADVITVNTDATGALAVIAFGVTGANTTTPWDTNSRAPWFYDVTGGNPTTSLYTNAASTMLLALYGADGVGTAGTIDAGFTYVTATSQSEHVGDTMQAALAYQIVSAAQSNLQAQYGQSGGTFNNRSIMTDAIVAAGESGTADEVYWYFDQGSGADIVISASGDNQTASVTGVAMVNPDLMTIVMVMIQSASGLGEVTSINDSNNLAPASPGFQRRSRKTDSTGTLALEVWWAYTPNALNGNDTINVLTTETAPGDVISVIVFGVGGTSGSIALGDPFWDGATDLPALADTDSGGGIGVYPNTTITSTITQNCLLLGFTANATVDETGGATLPFYPFESTASAGPAANLAIEFLYSSALVSDQLVEFDTSPSPHTWVMIADAIPVGLPVPPNGVWGSTEAKDTLTHTGDFSEIGIDGTAGWVGYPAGTGVIAATEAKDKFTGAPAQAPYDSVGWLGWVPAFATMAAVDTKDHASLGGWVIGAGGISGRWTSTDAPDRWSLSNIGPAVTGTMHPVELTDRWASAGFILPVVPPPTPRKRRLLIIT